MVWLLKTSLIVCNRILGGGTVAATGEAGKPKEKNIVVHLKGEQHMEKFI